MRGFLAALLLLFLAMPAQAQIITPSEMLRSSVTNYIRPQMKRFANSAEKLATAAATLCKTPSQGALDATRDAFSTVALSYGRIEFLRIGPLVEENRSDRILFWPDRRSIGLKQVQALLAEEDKAATDLAGLQAKSVAVQGLGALEFVLYGTGAETLLSADGAYRCAYGQAIALNLQEIGADMLAGWSDENGIATRLTQPGPGYADYRTTTESLEAIVGLVAHGIEAVRDMRVNPFIAKGKTAAKPKLALFWRSELTVPMLRSNIEGLRSLIELSGVVTNAEMAGRVSAAFDRALVDIDAVKEPVEKAVEDPAQAEALADLVVATQELQQLIGEDLSATLGLSVGFSSMDGD